MLLPLPKRSSEGRLKVVKLAVLLVKEECELAEVGKPGRGIDIYKDVIPELIEILRVNYIYKELLPGVQDLNILLATTS